MVLHFDANGLLEEFAADASGAGLDGSGSFGLTIARLSSVDVLVGGVFAGAPEFGPEGELILAVDQTDGFIQRMIVDD